MIHEPLSLGVTLALDPLFNPKDIVKRNEQYKFNHWLTIPPYIKTMVDLSTRGLILSLSQFTYHFTIYLFIMIKF